MAECLVCLTELNDGGPDRDYDDCPRCGKFRLSRTVRSSLPTRLMDEPNKRAVLSHTLRKMQADSDRPFLSWEVAKRITDNEMLPTPQEQEDNLILLLGDRIPEPGAYVRITPHEHTAIIGAKSPQAFSFIVTELAQKGIIGGGYNPNSGEGVTLTLRGWERCKELRSAAPTTEPPEGEVTVQPAVAQVTVTAHGPEFAIKRSGVQLEAEAEIIPGNLLYDIVERLMSRSFAYNPVRKPFGLTPIFQWRSTEGGLTRRALP